MVTKKATGFYSWTNFLIFTKFQFIFFLNQPYVKEWASTYFCKFVTVYNVENLSIEGGIVPIVQIFPVPVVSLVILWKSLSLDEFSYSNKNILFLNFSIVKRF